MTLLEPTHVTEARRRFFGGITPTVLTRAERGTAEHRLGIQIGEEAAARVFAALHPERAPRPARSPLRERQPVELASIFAERGMAMRRARPAAGPPAAPRTIQPHEPEPLSVLLARRNATMAHARGRQAHVMRAAGLSAPWDAR